MVTYNKVKNGTDMTNKRVKLKTNDTTQWKDGEIISYDKASTKACIELEGDEHVFINLAECVSSKHCWIYDISDYVHPLHQITVPAKGQITVRRADGQNLADST